MVLTRAFRTDLAVFGLRAISGLVIFQGEAFHACVDLSESLLADLVMGDRDIKSLRPCRTALSAMAIVSNSILSKFLLKLLLGNL